MKSLMEKLEHLLELGGIKKDIALLVISGIAVVLSLLGVRPFPFDMAWVAIVLCGVPIILEAVIGLVTAFDIKADVLVSLALISDIGKVIEISPKGAKITGSVTAGQVFVDGYGVGDVGSVVLRDRRHLAQDGVIVVVLSMSGEDGSLVSGPDIITRGFVYVKESEGLLEELRQVALEAIESVDSRYATDWSAIKSAIKGDLSGYLYKKTKRSPMILPVIMEV